MFYAFNYTLNEYLKSKKFNPIIDDNSDENVTCVNWKNGRSFWRYSKNQELGKAIKEWDFHKSNF